MSLVLRVAALSEGEAVAPAASKVESRLDHYCRLALAGEYNDAYVQLRADEALTPAERKRIIGAVNDGLLFGRRLEWGNHGIKRSFRFWSEAQKKNYVGRSIELVDLLRNELTPHVCFGFGSVLGMIRDGDMIAHDDDMDLIVALPARRRLTFRKVLTELRALLRRHDYAAAESANLNHVSTARNRQAGTDVFIGFIDPDRRVSWFPSRRGSLNFGDVFPVASMRFFVHDCPHYDGSVLAIFPKDPTIDMDALAAALNAVDWADLGFICDGRFLFTQRSLEQTPLPKVFRSFLPESERSWWDKLKRLI